MNLTLDSALEEIKTHYEFFAHHAPGVIVQEEGTLAQLWAFVDAKIIEHAKTLTYEECVSEYGYMTAMEREL